MTANGNGTGGAWDKNTPLQYVTQVMQKLQDGRYPTVATRCFCGSEPNDTVITSIDRYTLPHRMVMCENCLLMRANPRMTEEAYQEFYQVEYRKIYDGFPYGEKSEDEDFLFENQVEKGRDLKGFIEKIELDPKSVIDIGSDKGGGLVPFKEAGAIVYGVEWCERGRKYSLDRDIETVASIDELVARGIKADLVIMQDMIEHFMDLREVEKIKDLLNEGGRLFIYTPGFLAAPAAQHFQNAHTFQFIGATLEYVMNRMGYIAEFLDDRIVSVWKYEGDNLARPAPPPLEWRPHIMEHLEGKERRLLPPVRTRCKFSEKEMLVNLESNLAQGLPLITELKDKFSGPIVVIGGGPSIDGQVDKIKELVGRGAALTVIERMYPWCSEVGLKPDFVVALDASDGVEDGFTHIQPGVKHFIVATIKPEVLKVLDGHQVYLYAGAAGSFKSAQKHWAENGYGHVMIVNTGSTVVTASLMLALILGFRDLHLFGFDCMIPNAETTYAKGIAGESVDRTYFEVEIEGSGETVLTCPSYLAFAQQFFLMMETARKHGMIDSITVYGESLVNKMWDGDLTAVDDGLKANKLAEENRCETTVQIN